MAGPEAASGVGGADAWGVDIDLYRSGGGPHCKQDAFGAVNPGLTLLHIRRAMALRVNPEAVMAFRQPDNGGRMVYYVLLYGPPWVVPLALGSPKSQPTNRTWEGSEFFLVGGAWVEVAVSGRAGYRGPRLTLGWFPCR
jgi:hypothetical protein